MVDEPGGANCSYGNLVSVSLHQHSYHYYVAPPSEDECEYDYEGFGVLGLGKVLYKGRPFTI